MTTDAISEHVFLDTEVFVRFYFKYSSPPFKSLIDLIAKGRLKLLITDVVIKEVEARIEEAVRGAIGAHKRFSKENRVLGSATLAEVTATVTKLDEAAVVKDLKDSFFKFLVGTKAVTVPTNSVSIDEVMQDYFAGKAPFGSGHKKAEFPDAITVKALADWGDSESAAILVVSADNGLRDACDPVDYLRPSKSIQEMLDNVADDDNELAEFIRTQIEKHDEEMKAAVIHEFEDRYFYVVDGNGDADVTVKNAKFEEVDILEVGDKEAVVEVVYDLGYEANLSYDDPDRESYDSETGRTMSWGTREETVQRQAWTHVDVQVTFDGLDPDCFEIVNVTVTEPPDAVGVQLYDLRDDK